MLTPPRKTGLARPLPADPALLVDTLLQRDRRVLLVGQPGIGKSTLVNGVAERLWQAGRTCRCLGADPGSPLFGVPGAVCLGQREQDGWRVVGMAALCSLDAGRFRLPLVMASQRLLPAAEGGLLLVDGPGVVRGVAGAELLTALVTTARIDAVLVLVRPGRPVPLQQELRALPVEVCVVEAAPAASRPGKHARAVWRTGLWDAYLAGAADHSLEAAGLRYTGTPPPPDVPPAWVGRQVALLDDAGRTLAMGEVLSLRDGRLSLRLPPVDAGKACGLLVRDALRQADGRLGSAPRYAAEPFAYLPPPDLAPHAPTPAVTGPRPVGRVGMLGFCLVNGVFGDPLLHVRLRHRRRSLLFDLGEGSRLPARVAHQVSDVFISHAHIDHIAGFLWLLRSRIGETSRCRLFGPPGLAANIDGLMRGILWDRIGDRGPVFEVAELDGDMLRRYRLQGGMPGSEPLEVHTVTDGVVLMEPGFRVRATTLEHVSPVLAYALEPAQQLNIRKDRLQARSLPTGSWLGELKRRLLAGEDNTLLELPDGSRETVESLADDLVIVSPGRALVYATDFRGSPSNRERLVALARGAHTLFCEATFIEADAAQAERTAHLTTRACAGIAEAAGVSRLVPFHFSRRYEKDPGVVYAELTAATGKVVTPDTAVVAD